jgi:hypothetical protein
MGFLSGYGHARRNWKCHVSAIVLRQVSSVDMEPFIMRMTADWFATAKRHLALPAHGRSVHHVKGHEVQAILSTTNYDSLPTPQDWEFEVLTKKVVFHTHH